jgi:hypothetical protein
MSARRVSLGLVMLCAITCACGDDNPEKPGPPALSFALQPPIPLGSTLWRSIASVDFNHDGNADLAACSSESNLVYVTLGRGDGTFQSPRRIPVAEIDVTAGDFDGDGNLDLATSRLAQGVTFLYGRGDGNFDVISSGFHYLDQFTGSAGDFNGDGIDDYAGQASDSVAVVLGNSSRAHTRVVSYLIPRAGGYGEGVAADIDGDSHVDYAVGNQANHANVYYGNGDGSFQSQATPSDAGWDMGMCSIRPRGGTAGRDLAIAHNIGDVVGVLRRVSGAFVAEVTYPLGTSLTDVGAGDLDMNGVEDLVVCGLDTNSIMVLRGYNDGTYAAAKPFHVGGPAQSLAVVDVNNDGLPDVAVVGFREMYVLLNTTK